MPERQSYSPGTPSWVDIGTDVAAAQAFYCPLMGWEAVAAGPEEATGGYGFFTLRGRLVAGYGPQQNPGPPYWSTFVSVADTGAVAGRVVEAGGSVVVEPQAVMDAGRVAVFTDPEGIAFSVWQPARHIGAELVNEPGSLCWNELNTRNRQDAQAFYGSVFGWTLNGQESESGFYGEFSLSGRIIAGLADMMRRVPDYVPAHWNVYFAVADCDATVGKASELGGDALVGPLDVAVGRFAVLQDPQGATFSVIALVTPDD